MEPMKLQAALKDYLWGGDVLKREWGKATEKDVVAESWELSAHRDGPSRIVSGAFAGKTLPEVLAEHPEYAGERAKAFPMFPVLIKLIDSRQDLSIQVHPSDEYALKNEGQFGKTEMWYVVDAAEGAGIYYGFKRDVTRAEYEAAIENDTVTDLLNFVPVKRGETYFIESGTVHAICAGLLICEIQQNSNVTYRVYDYGRVGADGKKRELHVAKALDVSCLRRQSPLPAAVEPAAADGATLRKLASCRYFTAWECETGERFAASATKESFVSLTFLAGEGSVDGLPVKRGDTVFLPAGYGPYEVKGSVRFLRCEI